MSKQTDRTAYPISFPREGDYVLGVDVSDTSQSAEGSTRAFYRQALFGFDAVSDLIADNSLSYTEVAAGDILQAGGFRYEVAASGASDQHVSTAGGVKLYVKPLGLDYFVDAFGAAGDGSDDSAEISAAADAVRAAGRSYGLLFMKPSYRADSALDFTEIRRIQMIGELQSSVTSGAAITIGTQVSANTAMEGGYIQIFCRSTAANNSGLEGTSGIRVRGSARCNFVLRSYQWDVSIELAPQTGTGVQYIAFNTFTIDTNRSRTGLKFNGNYSPSDGNGWINENTFLKADLYPQSNALPGDTIGVHFADGGYTNNKNVFLDVSVETQNVPIWFERGSFNRIQNVRLEGAGSVKFGETGAASDKSVIDNYVHGLYPDGSANSLAVEWNATRPNLVAFGDASPVWFPILTLSYEDFFKVGSAVYSSKWLNDSSGTTLHSAATLNDSARSFDVGSNHSAYVDVPVETGDVLRVQFDYASGGGNILSMSAVDAAGSFLGTLSAGDTPYLGTNASASASATSQTSSTIDHNNTSWANPFLLSVNRSEVKFVRFRLRSGVPYTGLFVEKLLRSGQAVDVRPAFPKAKTIADTATTPDYPGQLAFLGGSETLIGINQNTWRQLSVPTDTAANIANATANINTANKYTDKRVWDSTNNREMRARGSGATAVWDVVDGSASVTPV